MPFNKAVKRYEVVYVIEIIDEDSLVAPMEERLGAEALEVVIMNFDVMVSISMMTWWVIGKGYYTYAPNKLDLHLKNKATPPARPCIEILSILELKAFPSHKRYVFLLDNNTVPIIIEYFLYS